MASPKYQPPPEDAVARVEIELSKDQYLVVLIHDSDRPGEKEIAISRLQQGPEVAGVEQPIIALLNHVVIEEDGRVIVVIDKNDWKDR